MISGNHVLHSTSDKEAQDSSSNVSGLDAGSVSNGSSFDKSGNNSTTGNGTVDSRTSDDDINGIKDALARQETKAVFRLRILVLLVLAFYHIIHTSEVEKFETDFYAVAEVIVENLERITDSSSSVAGLAATISSNAQMNSAPGEQPHWPFVTMTDFQERALTARGLSGSLYLSVNPVVDQRSLEQWDDYVLSDANSWM